MKRELELSEQQWEFIDNLTVLSGRTASEFIWECVAEYQNPDKEENKKIDWRAFDEFWAVYPLKVAKKPAKTIWQRINPRPELAKKIVEDVKKRKWKEGFIPHPTTYLTQRRWEDETKEVRAMYQPPNQQTIVKPLTDQEWEERRIKAKQVFEALNKTG